MANILHGRKNGPSSPLLNVSIIHSSLHCQSSFIKFKIKKSYKYLPRFSVVIIGNCGLVEFSLELSNDGDELRSLLPFGRFCCIFFLVISTLSYPYQPRSSFIAVSAKSLKKNKNKKSVKLKKYISSQSSSGE